MVLEIEAKLNEEHLKDTFTCALCGGYLSTVYLKGVPLFVQKNEDYIVRCCDMCGLLYAKKD